MKPLTVALGDLTRIRTGKLDANAANENGAYPFFTCAIEPLSINTAAFDCKAVLVAGNGDLNVKYYEGKFNAYQRTYVIESLDESKLLPKYLYLFLDKYVTKLREQAIGGVIKYIKLGNLTEAKIPLPPLPQQKRITVILDKAEEIKAKREQAIAKLDELAASAFTDAVKETDEFLTLNQIAQFQSGGTPSKENDEYWGGDIAWISSADIVNDKIEYGRNFITRKGLNNSATSLAEEGQILVVTRTGVGKVAIADRETCFSQDIVALSLKDGYETNFVAAAIRANKASFIRQARGATIQGITKEVLGAAQVPKLSMRQQENFSRALNGINHQRNRLEIARNNIDGLIASLQHQAFTTGFKA
jgi:type I restriction enzyme S subunit